MSVVPYIPGIQDRISALPKLTPSSAAEYIKVINDIISSIKAFIEKDFKYEQSIKDTWLNQLAWLQSLGVLKEKRIGLYGAAGVGKSSLIQALLGEPSLLPTDSQRACTACVCEIRNNPDDQNYKAYIKFLTINEWKDEVETLLMMLSDKQGNRKLKSKNNQDREQIVSKLKSVYGPNDMEKWTVEKLCQDARLKEYLKENSHEITLIASTASDLRKELKEYLTSPKTKNTMALWPLIKRVEIRGPFDILHGISLVDLPGFGDWNAARDKIAQDNLSSCDSIWVVAEATRASDSSTFKKTLSDNMQRQLLMDGKMSELVYICTKSDVIEVQDDDLENLQLTEEYEKIDARIEELEDNDDKDSSFQIAQLQQDKKALACIKRNESIKKILRENILEEIRQKLTNGQDSQNTSIQERYNNIPIFTISATSYIKLLKNKQDLTIPFSKPEQTELPQLQEFLRAEGYHRVDVVYDIVEKLVDIYQPIHIVVSHDWDHIISKMDECGTKVNICLRNLREKLIEKTSRLSAELRVILSDRLKKEVWKAAQLGSRDCGNNLTNYVYRNNIKWNTYKATCARDGEFRDFNFNQTLLDPFLNVITGGWESTFISDVEIIVNSYLKILETVFRDFLRSLEDIYEVASIPNEFSIPILKNFSSVIMRKALDLLNTMKQRIQTIQRNCRWGLLPIVRGKMIPGYRRASNCSGTGCYNMMKHYVDSQVLSVSNEIFSEIYGRVVSDLDGIIAEVDKACFVLADTSDAVKTFESFVRAIEMRKIGDWKEIKKQSVFFKKLIKLIVKVLEENEGSSEQNVKENEERSSEQNVEKNEERISEQNDNLIEDVREELELFTLD